MNKNDEFTIAKDNIINKCNDRYKDLKDMIEKVNSGDNWCKIMAWNIQSFNKQQLRRQVKVEFIRDLLNDNKFDFVYIIDANDDINSFILNGFKRYDDFRNILFVKDSICTEFKVYNSIIMSESAKVAFCYVTPSCKDDVLVNNVIYLIRNGFLVVGDLNLKSNPALMKEVREFVGEDSLQTGFVGKKVVKNYNIAGPSDHYAIFGYCKLHIDFKYNLRLKEISDDVTKENIFKILNGEVPKFKPKVVVDRGYFTLNDRENTMNNIIDDYLKNNVTKAYRRYNYLWKFNRREPFLGTHVNKNIEETFAEHLRRKNDKTYVDCEFNNDIVFNGDSAKLTRSRALNYEFMTLKNISEAVNLFVNENEKLDPDKRVNIFANIFKVANELKHENVARTFFLQKDKKLHDFNDVRVIVIMPTILKIYEALIYDEIVSYFDREFKKGPAYQFGGLPGGSTYKAILKIRRIQKKLNSNTLMMIDLAKGYDCIDMTRLDLMIDEIEDQRIKFLLKNWMVMVKNLDYEVNGNKIKRTRGIAMGLSLSPVIFCFYLDKALKNFDKSNISGYIDDLGIIIPEADSIIWRKKMDDLINALEEVGFVVNLKKTVIISTDPRVIHEFGDKYRILNADKYLGRTIGITTDGRLMADNRFYALKMFRSRACPYWINFGIKRLVFNGAIDASLRYKMFMWACDTELMRTAMWRNAWCFFSKNFGKFSYFQLVNSAFNYFRYCIDAFDVENWLEQYKAKRNKGLINVEVINKLMCEQKQLRDCIATIKINWKIFDEAVKNNEDIFEITRKFTEDLFTSFKANLLNQYIKSKRDVNKSVFPLIGKFVVSKLFKEFGVLHNIVFLHSDAKKRTKQIFLYNAIKVIGELMIDAMNKIKSGTFQYFDINKVWDAKITDFGDRDWNDMAYILWDIFICAKYEELWCYVLAFLELLSKIKNLKGKDIPVIEKVDDDVILICDGAFNEKENRYGYGGIVKTKDNVVEFSGGGNDNEFAKFRNIAGEVLGVIEGLKKVKELNFNAVSIWYDCQCLERWAQGAWKANNLVGLWYKNELRAFKDMKISWVKVPSHVGIEDNEIADKLAKKGAHISSTTINPNNIVSVAVMENYKSLYKILFRFLSCVEMICLNYNVSDYKLEELWICLRIKYFATLEFCDKLFNVSENEIEVDLTDFYG